MAIKILSLIQYEQKKKYANFCIYYNRKLDVAHNDNKMKSNIRKIVYISNSSYRTMNDDKKYETFITLLC